LVRTLLFVLVARP